MSSFISPQSISFLQVSVTTNSHRLCSAFESGKSDSKLCFWNLNRNVINVTEPDRQIIAPGRVRALSYASENYLLAAGFTNGDIRLLDLETEEWSAPYTGHKQAVTYIYWKDQILVSGAQDSSFMRWRFSKSKNALQQKGIFVTDKNYGSPGTILD